MSGRVLAITLAQGGMGERELVAEARAAPDAGFDGDSKGAERGDITLIAKEGLDGLKGDTGIEFSHEESGRNVLTEGIDLNALVGKRFKVGEVECVGTELCEPCNHLEQTRGKPGVLKGLVHRAGLNADVLSEGTIRVGDPVVPGESE